MGKKPVLILPLLFFTLSHTLAQLPDSGRRAAWHRAGIHDPIPDYKYLFFNGDTTGLTDNTPSLQSILDTISHPLTILFGKGNFLFNSKLRLKSNTILKGVGADRTHFIFNQNASPEPSIEFSGSQTGNYPLLENAFRNDTSILLSLENSALFTAGDYFRLVQDDADLLQPGWPETITGQVLKVDSVVDGSLYFSSPLRMTYEVAKNARVRIMKAVIFSGVECLKITREDYTNSGIGSSNIEFRLAANCHVRGVESFKCNFAHVEVNYSTNLQMEDNYFHDAHNWGSGGRAYGVMLQFATGEVLVQNNIFRRLRHAMILQGGANGNVFAYNYAYQGRKESLPNIFVVGEDLVSHGNFPYLNLFEGNYAQFASVDNSHGRNGPFNTFFRNIATNGGFRVTNSQSVQQNFTGNLRISGIVSFTATEHHITDNNWQGNSTLNDTSLFLKELPAFLDTAYNWLIGPPAFSSTVSNPARNRALAASPITLPCDEITWKNGSWVKNLPPSLHTKDYHLIVYPGSNLLISSPIEVKKMTLKPEADLEIAPGVGIKIHE
jgi:hypothetical protein